VVRDNLGEVMAYSVGLDLNDRQYLILRAVPQGFTIMGTTITELTQSYGPIKRIANYTLIRIHACIGIIRNARCSMVVNDEVHDVVIT